ncbi:MAG: hypothetical protein GKS00_14410 [Alphaproteobacteria bacterium]|nr:hypothetical protein [Alphaproteobacteria bacterium]
MTTKSKEEIELDSRLEPYAKRDSIYSIVLSLAGFAGITLILLGSPYFAAAVIVAAAAGIARHIIRKKQLVIREEYEGAMDSRNRGIKYPGKTTKDSPFTELFRKLGH